MKTPILAAIGVTILCASTAQAVEVTGGSVALSYSAFAGDTSVRRIGVEGSVEVGFSRNFSAQFDLSHDMFNTSNADVTTFGFHTIYHVNDVTSLGAFYEDEEDSNFYGIEASYETGQWEFEGFLARSGDDANVLGVGARYELANEVGITGAFAKIDLDGANLSTFSVRFDRDVATNANLYAELGTARVSTGGLSGTEPYVGLGAKILFGADRGATFDARGLARLLPGG